MASHADIDAAIRSRRTHKAFQPEPLDRTTILEILDLARWAPNHKLTNPWRFRVLGPEAHRRLKEIAEAEQPGAAVKLDRAPTLICATALLRGEDRQQREDLLAVAVACYIVLLAAHARGLAGYWRTVDTLDRHDCREALGIACEETPVGLLHLGYPRQVQRAPERAAVEQITSFLD